MTACQTTTNDEQTIASIAPTVYQNQNKIEESPVSEIQDTSKYDFIIERYRLKDPGSNISVDSALKLIIDEINPAMRIKLKSGEKIAYKFHGYRLFEDGNCYLIGFGTNSNQGFEELYRFAVSYNKTIYESQVHDGNDMNYSVVYSLDGDENSQTGSITATIKNGTLSIKDSSSKKVINTFRLSKYNIKGATTSDIHLMDMNFDGYSDVSILQSDSSYHLKYYAFLYDPESKKFKYENAYCNLPSPEFDTELKTIICSEKKEDSIVFDTYTIVNNQPEIKERLSYKYIKNEKVWRMERLEGENGDLRLIESKYYTSKQVSDETGEFITN